MHVFLVYSSKNIQYAESSDSDTHAVVFYTVCVTSMCVCVCVCIVYIACLLVHRSICLVTNTFVLLMQVFSRNVCS